MKNSLFLFFSQYRVFWRLRSFVHTAHFWSGVGLFQSQNFARGKKDSFVELRNLFQTTLGQLIWALLFAIFLQLIDPVVLEFYKLSFFKIPDDSDYVTFLVTISGISGVFIGLYYTAISTIAGSIYAKVPNNIRDLLAQERTGNVYMNFLSFITFLGISLVSFRVLGCDRIHLAIPIMLVSAGVGIIAFVKLGQRAFYLFDPTALSQRLFVQLQQYITMVSAGRYRWDDANFQRHAHKWASFNLNTLETLSSITKKEVHLRGAPYISLSKNIILFLSIYESKKKFIPSDSQWYGKKYEYRDLYRTEDYQVSIAHQAGTTLQPDVTNNKEWIEERVLPIIRECFEVNLKEEKYNEILELAGYIDNYLELLAKNGRTDRALSILEELGESVLKVISPVSETEIVSDEALEKLAIVERFASMPINIALACREHIEEIDLVKLEREISKISWNKEADLYKHDFSTYWLPRLEWFKPRLSFEVLTEGRTVTPIWYQKELLLQIESDNFVNNTKALITQCSSLYKTWIAKTTDDKHPWLVGAVMSREWEFWHKVDNQMEIWSRKWSDLSDENKIEGLPWSDFDYEKLKQASKDRQSKLLELMSKQSITLASSDRPVGFPDYAGQFLHTSGEVSFGALLSNDQDLLRNVFGAYFFGCLVSFDNFQSKSSLMDWRAQQDFKIAVAPLLDLIDLSGYARLMADYHDNEQLWEIVTEAWENYITGGGEDSSLSLLATSISLTEGTFEVPHRGELRTKWKRRISQKLSDVPRSDVSSRHYINSDMEIDHNSPLIRIFARGLYMCSYDGIDIFITFYLRTKDGGDQLDFGRRRRDFQDPLDREIARAESQEGAE